MESLFYARFIFSSEGRIVPNVLLLRNYQELVSSFYQNNRKKDIEKYVDEIRDISQPFDINLLWDNIEGLTSISIGPSAGLDLSNVGIPHFQEHNLGTRTTLYASAIAQQYIYELLK